MRALVLTLLITLILLCNPLCTYGYPKECIIINVPSRTLDLYKGGKLIKTYPVGVGRAGFPTPIGNFKVIRMVKEPGWENPYKPKGHIRIKAGGTNPLGTRWIGFKADDGGEFGIHGTDTPSSVGKYSSHGCVRMLVKDAEDLFSNTHMGMPVLVTYDTAKVVIKNSNVFIHNYPDAYKRGKSNINNIKNTIKEMNSLILWNASATLQALETADDKPIKIGTIIDESDFY